MSEEERVCRKCKRTEGEIDDLCIGFAEEFAECEECDPEGASNMDAFAVDSRCFCCD
jgi:hypothetical protein